jgi:hypothetical protein
MRLFCRVFLVLLLIAVTARAADNKQPVSGSIFTVQRSVNAPETSAQSGDRVVFPPRVLPHKFRDDNIELRQPCLTIRSMQFSRRNRDQVQYQRMTTCTPANQFQVKHAVVEAPTP